MAMAAWTCLSGEAACCTFRPRPSAHLLVNLRQSHTSLPSPINSYPPCFQALGPRSLYLLHVLIADPSEVFTMQRRRE